MNGCCSSVVIIRQLGSRLILAVIVQDIKIMWWPIFAMIDHLLNAKTSSSCTSKWTKLAPCSLRQTWRFFVRLISILINPVRIAEKLLEGETYVMVSLMLVPYIISDIRYALNDPLDFLKLCLPQQTTRQRSRRWFCSWRHWLISTIIRGMTRATSCSC